jgi:transcriptional regulator with XRE-family HTH domain
MDGNQRITRQIGATIRRLRLTQQKTQRQLAAAAGIPPAELAAYENGRVLPDRGTLQLVLSSLGVTSEEFGRHLGPWRVVRLDVRITVTVSQATPP